MQNLRRLFQTYLAVLFLTAGALHVCAHPSASALSLQSPSRSAIETEIENQRQRLSSSDAQERRDALMKLGSMRRAAASRVALTGLSDASPMVRAVAAKAILSLGPEESVPALIPLTADKDEFVRRESAYALGLTRSPKAIETLTSLLLTDKEDGVRSAAAVALGDIGDESAVVTLSNILTQSATSGKSKKEKNIFVLRAAAKALGQTKSKAAVTALVAALSNEKLVEDVRREAATALGSIGDPAALPALRTAASSADPYLSQAALASIRHIAP